MSAADLVLNRRDHDRVGNAAQVQVWLKAVDTFGEHFDVTLAPPLAVSDLVEPGALLERNGRLDRPVGSEATGVAIFDLSEKRAKTGIAHRRLKPTLGRVDPENIRTLPPPVIASTGLDVLCHALESYTALPFTDYRTPAQIEMGLHKGISYLKENPRPYVWKKL